jgi:site-specific recombinase XerD
MTGVKFLLKVTMRRHDLVAEIYHLREPQALAVVLAPEEVAQVLAYAPSLKARVMLTIGYGCGLRGGEVTRLKVRDIDSAQGIIRVVQGKGQKDRNVMLPSEVLALGERWIFPGHHRHKPISPRQFHRLLQQAAAAADIKKPVTLHTLRHSFATHLHESGTDIRVIQAVLGHASLSTTARYTRVATGLIAKVESPLDRLSLPKASGRKRSRPKGAPPA